MNTAIGYKIEQVNISSLFRGFQSIHKTVKDKYDEKTIWIYASRVSNGIKTNGVLKYNKDTKAVDRVIDFGQNEVYSIHISQSYIAFLSSPATQGTKRYLSFLNRSGANTEAVTSLLYNSTVQPSAEFNGIYEDNMMHFDGRYYWTLPKSSTIPIKKIDIVEFGSNVGLEGINAPGGSCKTALTSDITDWCPSADAILDCKAYLFQGDLYFFPRGAGAFKLNVTTSIASNLNNADYTAMQNRMAYSIYQIEEEAEFSESGEIIVMALRSDENIGSPINTIGFMDLSTLDFTTLDFPAYAALGQSDSDVTLVENNKIFFSVSPETSTGIFLDCNTGEISEYHILGAESSILSTYKYPGSFLNDTTMLFIEENSVYAYKMTSTTPCRVIVHHILEDGSMYKAEEVLYGEAGTEYNLLAEAIEGKEVSSVIGYRSGVFTVKDIIVDFYYSQLKPKTFIKVVSKDTSANILQEYTLEGFIGDSYSTTESIIPGYTIVTVPENATGTLVADNVSVEYIYRKLTSEETYGGSSYLSISYEDESGNQILPSLYTVFPIGSSYSIPAEAIPGFNRVSAATISGTCYDKTEYITFVYSRIAGNGLARIDYNAGSTVIKSEYVAGVIDSTASYTPTEIEGFSFSLTPFNVTTTATISVYTIECEPVVGLLIVHHKDIYDSKDIFPKEYYFTSVSGITSVDIREKNISNYKSTNKYPTLAKFNPEYDEWSTYQDGALHTVSSGKTTEVTITYDTVMSSVLTLHKKGETVLSESTVYGANGDAYSTLPIYSDAIEIDTISGETSGYFGSRQITVTYNYKDRICTISVEHVEVATGDLILRTDYTGVYGTEKQIPFQTFNGYAFVETSLTSVPDAGVEIFEKDPKTVRFYHLKIDTAKMTKIALSINAAPAGVEVNCNTSSKVIDSIRYKVEKRLNAGTWTPCLPLNVDSTSIRTTNRVLNIIEDDGNTITFTHYLDGSITIPAKAIVKQWVETIDNQISVDIIDAREFELNPSLYLRDADGNIKYTTIVDGTYSEQERCQLSQTGEQAITDWKTLGLGYVDCSKKYKMTGRIPSITTEADLLIRVLKDMHNTTGLNTFVSEAKESPSLNWIVSIDDIKYDKILNRVVIKVSPEDNLESNPDAVYEYKVTVMNINDGTTYASTDVSPTTTINTSMPIERYLFEADSEQSTYPGDDTSVAGTTLYYNRQETIRFIDIYLHIVGEDLFGRRTALLNHRYYKEITAEDFSDINSVITHSPKIVKENHRYRGPVESKKENNFRTGIANAIEELYGIYNAQETKLQTLKTTDNADVYALYIDMKDRSEV